MRAVDLSSSVCKQTTTVVMVGPTRGDYAGWGGLLSTNEADVLPHGWPGQRTAATLVGVLYCRIAASTAVTPPQLRTVIFVKF